VTPQLHELEPRLVPSPFPEVPSYVFYLGDAPPLIAALAPGGPRIVWGDVSVYLADPSSRLGVNIEGVRVLLAAAGERVLGESETPAEPAGIDPAANSVTWGFGLFDGATVGVGLVFDTAAGPSEREQQDRLYLPQDLWAAIEATGRIDPYSVYVAMGDEISRARTLPRYVEVQLSGPGAFSAESIAADVLGRLRL
jgi:hypothetical protein